MKTREHVAYAKWVTKMDKSVDGIRVVEEDVPGHGRGDGGGWFDPHVAQEMSTSPLRPPPRHDVC